MRILRSVVYVSVATHAFTTPQLETLLTDARAFNCKQGVTGVLLYSGRRFMQCFEGAAADVDEVYARIKRSSQHQDIVEYMNVQVPRRTFSSWQMGLARPSESDMLALSTAEWSSATQAPFSAESPAGLEMLKVFWSMRQGTGPGSR